MSFLEEDLFLSINLKSDIIRPVRHGIRFLGSWIYPQGFRLQNRNRQRAINRLTATNQASYSGLIQAGESAARHRRFFDYKVLEILLSDAGN